MLAGCRHNEAGKNLQDIWELWTVPRLAHVVELIAPVAYGTSLKLRQK